MSTTFFEPVVPSATDAVLARESVRRLAPQLARANGNLQLCIIEQAGQSEAVAIPASAFRVLVTILKEMASGNAVRLVPHQTELTTEEAAGVVDMSRPYFVRLLDEGRIPFHKVGTHRRVLFKDVMDYKAEHRRARRGALRRLSVLDQELGLT